MPVQSKHTHNSYAIQPLNWRQIPRSGMQALVGRSGSGKSNMMFYYLLQQSKRYDLIVAMVGTRDTARNLRKFIPGIFIHYTWKPMVIQKLMDYLEDKLDRGKKAPRVLLLLDDLMFEHASFLKHKQFRRLASNGRHCLTVVVTLQDCKAIGPDIRGQFFSVFIGAENYASNRRRIYEAFNTVFPDFETFDEAMKALTRRYGFMVLDNTKRDAYDVQDCCFHTKAPNLDRKKKRVGSRSTWKYNKRYYDPRRLKDKQGITQKFVLKQKPKLDMDSHKRAFKAVQKIAKRKRRALRKKFRGHYSRKVLRPSKNQLKLFGRE